MSSVRLVGGWAPPCTTSLHGMDTVLAVPASGITSRSLRSISPPPPSLINHPAIPSALARYVL